MKGLNLLPWREQKKKSGRRWFFVLLIGAGISGMSVILIMQFYWNYEIKKQGENNLYLRAEVKTLDKELQQIKEIDAQKELMVKRIDLIESLKANRPIIVKAVDALVKIIPPGLYIQIIKREGKQLIIEGGAESNLQVSTLMLSAATSGMFVEPNLQEIKSGSKDGNHPLKFKLTLQVIGDNSSENKDK